ncbi:hypothetical protein PPL_05922 [Heterostelium album PN500]|uniref:C3HC-type domain-containing protein n=1 Tax=Heterostelium pallidum (strain ATCC 26659 / Pp 5 / PN500) TaxID=670386 RepID=D3BBQ3_HETP5|nr:hypothetical protein PPL_05922 [Heterostelium album PN500]EFA81086.1 hypothetical protein PPL_05922 [Heterostelium album PN500]|eukprot:XP_020433204.1 hypothetical protein PPL_05922 [Heterostelium album PN500]
MEDRIKKALNELDSATVIQTLSIPSQQTRELKAQQEHLQYQQQPQQQDYQHRPWSTDDYYFRVNTYSIGDKRIQDFALMVKSTGHRDTCPWKDNGCPTFYARLSNIPSLIQIESFQKRAQNIYNHLSNSILPLLDIEFWSNVQRKDKRNLLKALLSSSEITSDSGELKARISVILALCGWDYYSNNSNGNAADGSDHRDDNNHINIHCSYCQRVLGLWNFKSMNNNNSDISTVTIDDPFIQLYPNLQTQTTSTSHNNNNNNNNSSSTSTSLNVNNSLSSHTIGGRESTIDIQQQQQQQEEATVEDRKKVVFESLLSRSISSWSGSSSFISFKNLINPQSTTNTNTNTTPSLSTSTSTSNIQPVSSSSTIVDAQSSNNNVDEATLQQQQKEKEKEIQLKLQQQLQSEQRTKSDVGWSWGQRFVYHPTVSFNKAKDSIMNVSLSPIKEHRWFCPWVNDSKDEINDNNSSGNVQLHLQLNSINSSSGNTNNSSSSTSNTPTATTSATSTTSNNYQTSSQHTTTTSIKTSASGWENLLSIVVHNQFIPKSSFDIQKDGTLNRKLILPTTTSTTTTTNRVITNNTSNNVNLNNITI